MNFLNIEPKNMPIPIIFRGATNPKKRKYKKGIRIPVERIFRICRPFSDKELAPFYDRSVRDITTKEDQILLKRLREIVSKTKKRGEG